MQKLDRGSLWSLENYAVERDAFRKAVLTHKAPRRIKLGAHATLLFEDFLTMKYQVQEMLRAERIFEPAAIDEEIDAYNPLIPDGTNWKATLLLEYPDPDVRARELARMPGVEHRVWAEVAGRDRVFAIANEDLDRTNETKTAAVHFLRFEFDRDTIDAMRAGASITLGIDHEVVPYTVTLDDASRAALIADFD